MNLNWSSIDNLAEVASPGLLVDADRVDGNTKAMIDMAGGPTRLRPHVKTHKMPEVIRRQLAAGITRFKTATISETRMVAEAGGQDVLLAYQPVGPNQHRLAALIDDYPNTSFATVTDDETVAEQLNEIGTDDAPLRLFIDVDCGMHRTGIELGDSMNRLRDRIESLANLSFAGLHVYDGHLHASSLSERQSAANDVIEKVQKYHVDHPVPMIIGGGSPTFPCWASETSWQCSPGTTVFWDVGYGRAYEDLGFSIAIALVTRVISKPGDRRLCLDLGYKSIASEMPLENRVVISEIEDATFVGHSEEHLVLETDRADRFELGQPLLAFPRHICPTVALHACATVVRNQQVTQETWRVTARDR